MRLLILFVLVTLLPCTTLAMPADGLRVLTWNVWFDDESGKQRYPRLLEEVRVQEADVVLFQEVTPYFLDELRMHALGREYRITVTRRGLPYQNVTLSRSAPEAVQVMDLPSQLGRKALAITLKIPGSKVSVTVVNVHLESSLGAAEQRRKQLQLVMARTDPMGTTIIGGDFNFGNASSEAAWMDARFHDAAASPAQRKGVTYDVDNNPLAAGTRYWFESARRLDRIYVLGDMRPSTYQRLGMNAVPPLSDHYGVLADLQVPQ